MLCYAMLCYAMPVSPILAPIQRDAHHSPRHQFQCRSSSIPLLWLCVYVFVHLSLIWSFLSSLISASPAQTQYSIQYWKGLWYTILNLVLKRSIILSCTYVHCWLVGLFPRPLPQERIILVGQNGPTAWRGLKSKSCRHYHLCFQFTVMFLSPSLRWPYYHILNKDNVNIAFFVHYTLTETSKKWPDSSQVPQPTFKSFWGTRLTRQWLIILGTG